jgi:hypothetical protein
MCIIPWEKVALPVEMVITLIIKVSNKNTWDFASKPKVNVIPANIEITAATGIVRPTLANPEPKAKLKLFCILLAAA